MHVNRMQHLHPLRLPSRCLFTSLSILAALARPALANPADALLVDVERLVAAHEQLGWFIDKTEYEQLEEEVLESICRTPEVHRRAALSKLTKAASGKTATELYLSSNQQLSPEVKRALSRERRATALRRSLARIGECPFYIVPSASFEGRQTERNKWAFHLEGGGIAEGVRTTSTTTASKAIYEVGGGGNGRLLLGRGLGDSLSLLAGIELGGGAKINSLDQASQLSVKYAAALPVVIRAHRVSWFYDTELAPVAILETQSLKMNYGARVGFALGLTAVRAQDFLPWAGLGVTIDHYPSNDRHPARQLLRAGLRVGFRWLP